MENINISVNSPVLSRQKEKRKQTLDWVLSTINYYDFDDDIQKLVYSLAQIITDVLRLPPNCDVFIGRERKSAEDVQEIFNQIDERHIYYVLDAFAKVNYPIRNPKRYLRAALYNSVIEFEIVLENEYNARYEND